PNAMLDIKAKNKGILIPRMDSTVRLNLKGPIGLLVFDSSTKSFWYHNGKEWQNMVDGNGWSLTGNNNEDSNSFLGTTNSIPLKIKVNNSPAGLIDYNSSIGNTSF